MRGQEWSGCRLVEGVVSGMTEGEEEVPGTSHVTGPVQIVRDKIRPSPPQTFF